MSARFCGASCVTRHRAPLDPAIAETALHINWTISCDLSRHRVCPGGRTAIPQVYRQFLWVSPVVQCFRRVAFDWRKWSLSGLIVLRRANSSSGFVDQVSVMRFDRCQTATDHDLPVICYLKLSLRRPVDSETCRTTYRSTSAETLRRDDKYRITSTPMKPECKSLECATNF